MTWDEFLPYNSKIRLLGKKNHPKEQKIHVSRLKNIKLQTKNQGGNIYARWRKYATNDETNAKMQKKMAEEQEKLKR